MPLGRKNSKARTPDFRAFDSSSETGDEDMSTVLEAKATWLAKYALLAFLVI